MPSLRAPTGNRKTTLQMPISSLVIIEGQHYFKYQARASADAADASFQQLYEVESGQDSRALHVPFFPIISHLCVVESETSPVLPFPLCCGSFVNHFYVYIAIMPRSIGRTGSMLF